MKISSKGKRCGKSKPRHVEFACATCKYALAYRSGQGDVIYRECRYNPPTAIRVPCRIGDSTWPASFETVYEFPRVFDAEWCWKYEPR